MLPQKYS